MKEILIAIFLPQLILIPFLLIFRKRKKVEGGVVEPADDDMFIDGAEDPVLAILKSCFADLKRQGARGHGPWISALLDGPDMFAIGNDSRGRVTVEKGWTGAGADVALLAVRWTIRDILSAPKSYDKDGREMPRRIVNLDALRKAEAELEELLGEWD